MVDAKKVQGIYFSPTGTTRRIIEQITDNTGLSKVESIDLTIPDNRGQWDGETSASLVMVGVPTYYDTIPSAVLGVLNKLKGDGKWAVAVAVSGNVSYGECLEELCGLLRNRGFKILAGANFIGEHSFATDMIPLARGRPDGDDLGKASDFGRKIGVLVGKGVSEASIVGIPLKIGCGYMRRLEECPENSVRDIARVGYDEARCSRCLECVGVCPNSAIDADTLTVDDGLCTRCFACTRVCPTGAFSPVVVKDVGDFFVSLLGKRLEPRLFY